MSSSIVTFASLTHLIISSVCGDLPKANYRSLARSVVASLQVWPPLLEIGPHFMVATLPSTNSSVSLKEEIQTSVR